MILKPTQRQVEEIYRDWRRSPQDRFERYKKRNRQRVPQAAPSQVQIVSNGFQTGAAATGALTNVAIGDVLIAYVWWNALTSQAVSDIQGGISDTKGNTWIAVSGTYGQVESFVGVIICYSVATHSGATTVNLSLNATNVSFVDMNVEQVTGLTSAALDTQNVSTTSTGSPLSSGGLTTSTANEWVAGWGLADNAASTTWTAAFGTIFDNNNASGFTWAGSSGVQATAATVDPSFSYTGGGTVISKAMASIAFKSGVATDTISEAFQIQLS